MAAKKGPKQSKKRAAAGGTEALGERIAKMTGMSQEAIAAAIRAATAAAGKGEGEQARPALPELLEAAERGKSAAVQQVLDMQLLAGKDCSGAICAFSCSIGCIVGCGIFGGTTVAFGSLGGVAGGSGTAIAKQSGALAEGRVGEMSFTGMVTSRGGK